MGSLIEGYNYDIFISYRQKDNKYDGWVTEFVDNLKKELEATIKEDVSVYFDINPHDGLLESHEVSDSLKDKLKCLIFIPIISRTYCDPRSFAWEQEFNAFVEQASKDRLGLKIKLPGGNVALRVLPVRIYDLNKEDISLCESVIGGVLRGIEFIFRSPGVNRPLRANEDHAQDNLNKTYYRDQINKVSRSISEIIEGSKAGNERIQDGLIEPEQEKSAIQKEEFKPFVKRAFILPWKRILFGITILIVLITLALLILKYLNQGGYSGLGSEEVLDKAISFCDPLNVWPGYSGKVHLVHTRLPGEIVADETIEIDRSKGYYKCSSVYYGKIKVVKGIIDGKYFREINGKSVQGDEIDTKDIDSFRELHQEHFGLLMQLKASGLLLGDKVRITKFNSKECLALDFLCDTTRLKNNYFKNTRWTVFLDPKDFSTKGWQNQGRASIPGYSVYSGILQINGINIPMVKSYYSSVDDAFVAIDVFTFIK